MSEPLLCSSKDCLREAAETLFLRGQVGHVHDCPSHAALLREWCYVIHGEPIIDGECLALVCTGSEAIWSGQPATLVTDWEDDDE